jgi:hypothetical protein
MLVNLEVSCGTAALALAETEDGAIPAVRLTASADNNRVVFIFYSI